jgi:hypothetical protein
MAMNKKGYFFTLTVLLLIGIASLIVASNRNPGYEREVLTQTTRLQELNLFLDAVTQDFQTANYVSGHRSLLVLQEHVANEGALLNPEELLSTLIINGTLAGENPLLLENSSLMDWEERIILVAAQLRVNFTLEIISQDIIQEDPWHLTIHTKALLHLNDSYTTAIWHQEVDKKVYIPLENFHDPLYMIASNSKFQQPIRPFIEPITDLETHISQGYYIATPTAPSYLDRIKGHTNPSLHGIESLVNTNALIAVDIQYQGSIIDWQYLGTNDLDTCPLPTGLGSIARSQAARYGIICP